MESKKFFLNEHNGDFHSLVERKPHPLWVGSLTSYSGIIFNMKSKVKDNSKK